MTGSLTSMFISIVVFSISLSFFAGEFFQHIKGYQAFMKRVPENYQNIATECYVDDMARNLRITAPGYIMENGLRRNVEILDRSRVGEIKVRWNELNNFIPGHGYTTSEKWVKDKDFYPYYSLEQIAEKLNKTDNIKPKKK